ncbi:MAG: hypothetical protein H0U36_01950, partial [Nocardioidaceae bacterium]|nr:hypothetical protein [Nocardioidaceae bacterium]
DEPATAATDDDDERATTAAATDDDERATAATDDHDERADGDHAGAVSSSAVSLGGTRLVSTRGTGSRARDGDGGERGNETGWIANR